MGSISLLLKAHTYLLTAVDLTVVLLLGTGLAVLVDHSVAQNGILVAVVPIVVHLLEAGLAVVVVRSVALDGAL